ncbi:hypothetical protein [Nocardioides sp. TF02-7]|uniref:anti-sigma factor family protein n=1 Tax=Nocardioides sp. TF02-7 TaxID=2917724 RepID=UPI001F051100|nr:hypothetical protein [Nocardioides sp. TF02-7]UMG91767.1 hypothetical protein MF408_17150 [Nocardioides sp. TF02-7]
MIGHLGARVSALLDGQLPPAEAEEAWEHVYTCHACRDLVEREGWVKTRLAGLSCGPGAAPPDLKGSLLNLTPAERCLGGGHDQQSRGRRGLGVAVLGGGAAGAAMLGVIALGLVPTSTPTADRRMPASRVETPAVGDRADRSTTGNRADPGAGSDTGAGSGDDPGNRATGAPLVASLPPGFGDPPGRRPGVGADADAVTASGPGRAAGSDQP